MRELLLEIWTSVRRNKLRTFLTGFSVAWGIFMLVILLGSGNGLKNGVTSNFGNYATNSIDLYGGRTSKPYMGYQKGRRIRLWNSDLEILAREFPEVDEVAANSWFDNHTATYGNEYTKVWLRGSLPKIEQIEGVEIAALATEQEDGASAKFSLRSVAPYNVARDVAQPLGGGGHERAAGITIHRPLAEAVDVVLSRVREIV